MLFTWNRRYLGQFLISRGACIGGVIKAIRPDAGFTHPCELWQCWDDLTEMLWMVDYLLPSDAAIAWKMTVCPDSTDLSDAGVMLAVRNRRDAIAKDKGIHNNHIATLRNMSPNPFLPSAQLNRFSLESIRYTAQRIKRFQKSAPAAAHPLQFAFLLFEYNACNEAIQLALTANISSFREAWEKCDTLSYMIWMTDLIGYEKMNELCQNIGVRSWLEWRMQRRFHFDRRYICDLREQFPNLMDDFDVIPALDDCIARCDRLLLAESQARQSP